MPFASAAPPAESRRPDGERIAARWRVAGVVVVHALLLWGLSSSAPAIPGIAPPQSFAVELLAEAAAETPQSMPRPPSAPRRAAAATPSPAAPVATAPGSVAASAPPITAASSVTPLATAAVSAPTPAAVTPPRHDADYLHNPAPAYPALSRRLGEQGRVLLRILVSSEGRAESVEISSSSGSRRLDAAARDAVRDWRFVPARQGERAVAASVTVPISFHLDS